MEHLFERGVRRTRNHVATIGSESSGRDPEAHTIADESHRESEIATIESEAEAEEEENETSAELLREQEEAEKHKQEELKKLEKELKELADQLQNPSLSPEERDEIRQKISAVLGKIDAIRPANRQQQGEPHRQPQSSGQQTGGAQPPRGSHAPAGGGSGAVDGRGRESPVGGGANSARLVKSYSQQISHGLAEIEKELDADKKLIENAIKNYPKLLLACNDGNAIIELRKAALDGLGDYGERNRVRLKRLDKLVGQSSGFRSGQSVDPKFLVSITTCKQNCDQFAKRLESIKETLQELTPAKAKSIELSQRPNILQRHSGQAMRVH